MLPLTHEDARKLREELEAIKELDQWLRENVNHQLKEWRDLLISIREQLQWLEENGSCVSDLEEHDRLLGSISEQEERRPAASRSAISRGRQWVTARPAARLHCLIR